MKKIIFFLLLLDSVYAQPPGQWMWIHGSNTSNATGNFGTQGVPSPTNVPPALYQPCEWTDLNGNLWLFGGMRWTNEVYAALWKYEPATNQWTWMKGPNTINFGGDFGIQGVPSLSNLPPAISWGIVSWVDLQGNLWLFGGTNSGSPTGFAALWRYEISTNMWTWMKGPSTVGYPGVYGTQTIPDINNNPPAREECSTGWTDNAGDLWLFGGHHTSFSMLNDLWRYNIATNTWTWMKGSSSPNAIGVYGTLLVEDSVNTPGARWVYTHWKDNSGNLWLFGGVAYGSSNNHFNDVWKYNPVSNNWTWMAGSSSLDPPANYGATCTTSALSTPNGRYECRTVFTDQNGNFWLFGGMTNSGNTYKWNNLWLFCVLENKWKYIGGSGLPNPGGYWGTIGVPNPFNSPNGRAGAVGWYDGNSHFYMFGGTGTSAFVLYNDLWKYTIDTNCAFCNPNPMFASVASGDLSCYQQCNGSATVNISGGYPPFTYLWSNMQVTQSINGLCAGTYSVTITDSLNYTTTASIVITQPSQISANLSSTPTDASCIGTATAAPTGGTPPFQFLWSNSSTTTSINNLCSGWYFITITDDNDCIVTDSVFVNLNTGLPDTDVFERFSISPNPFNNSFTVQVENNPDKKILHLNLMDITGRIIISDFRLSETTELGEDLSQGIYNVEITSSNRRKVFKIGEVVTPAILTSFSKTISLPCML